MDSEQSGGNQITEVEHARHSAGLRQKISSDQELHGRKAGGSNYAFGDGSARFLPFAQDIYPINLWAVVPKYRTDANAGGP